MTNEARAFDLELRLCSPPLPIRTRSALRAARRRQMAARDYLTKPPDKRRGRFGLWWRSWFPLPREDRR